MFNPLQPLPQTSTAWGNQKKTQTCRFSLGKEREKWNIHPVSQLFRELSQGLVSVLSNLECWWSTPTYFGCLGTTENKELSGLLLHRWTCSTTNRHQREQKNKTLKKKNLKTKNWQTCLIEKWHTQDNQRCIPRRVEVPQIFIQADSEGLPCIKSVLYEARWLFLQMSKFQQKPTKPNQTPKQRKTYKEKET